MSAMVMVADEKMWLCVSFHWWTLFLTKPRKDTQTRFGWGGATGNQRGVSVKRSKWKSDLESPRVSGRSWEGRWPQTGLQGACKGRLHCLSAPVKPNKYCSAEALHGNGCMPQDWAGSFFKGMMQGEKERLWLELETWKKGRSGTSVLSSWEWNGLETPGSSESEGKLMTNWEREDRRKQGSY